MVWKRLNRAQARRGAGRGGPMVRSGLSMLEVVLAVALLGMVSASIAGTFGFVTMHQLRERQRLAASEVAHRLLLSYLDDPSELPDASRPVEYGPPEAPARFRWEYREEPIGLVEVMADSRDASRQGPLNMDRFHLVTFKVWLSEESGGTRYAEPGTPVAVLARMIDPIALRNPDSTMNMIGSEQGRQRFMEAMMGTGRGAAAPAPEAGSRLRMHQGMSPREAFQRGSSGSGGQRQPASRSSFGGR